MGLAPTTSTTMMVALGDALAVALMERRGFTASQYHDFHPGGSLGRKLIRVSDIMQTGEELPLVSLETRIRDVVINVMNPAKYGFAGHAGVVDKKGALVGIITDGDLRRHVERDLLDRKARDVMTRNPKTVPPEMLAAEALNAPEVGTFIQSNLNPKYLGLAVFLIGAVGVLARLRERFGLAGNPLRLVLRSSNEESRARPRRKR